MYFNKICINNYRNITNQIEIDFQSFVVDASVNNTYIQNLNNIKVLNKLGIIGKNAIGKTNLFKAISMISKTIKLKYDDIYEPDKTYKNVSLEEIKTFEFLVELVDEKNIVTFINNEYEESINFSTYYGKNYNINIKDVQKIFSDNQMRFSDIRYRDILNIIEKNKTLNVVIKDTKLWNLFKLFNVPFKDKAKYLQINEKYSQDMFDQSLWKKVFNTLSNIRILTLENSFFTGSALTEVDFNKNTLLKFLFNNKKILNNIEQILIKLDSDICNMELLEEDGKYNITFTKDKLDFFKCSSNGTKKLFGILSYLYFFKEQSSLFLLDELDATLNSYVVEQILKLEYWKNHQLVFSFHNSNILQKKFNVLKADQILFMRYKNNSTEKEIVSLADFEKFEDYKRNNKLSLSIIDNIFNTEPEIEIKM